MTTIQKYQELKKLLEEAGHPKDEVQQYISYCAALEQDSKGWWMKEESVRKLQTYFEQVKREGLVFDGQHVSLNKRGITYDYVAYKNKLLSVYPEAKVDPRLVYEGDTFTYSYDSGKLSYTYKPSDPFKQAPGGIIGAYCVIITDRGQFMTTLSKEEIDKHRQVSLMKNIWEKWYREMAYKTVIKKACKDHFNDVFEAMNEEDNKQVDLEIPLDLPENVVNEITNITTLEGLRTYKKESSHHGEAFERMIAKRQKELTT